MAQNLGPSRDAIVVTALHARRVQHALGDALAGLEREGIRVEGVFPVQGNREIDDAIEFARTRRIQTVIAAGGDGTAGSVANALAYTDMTLGVLPLGTSNDFARSLGLPMALDEACRALARGETEHIDIGVVTSQSAEKHYFVHAATLGVNSRFARLATKPGWRRRFGPLAYPLAAIRAVQTRKPVRVAIDADGCRMRGRVLQVAIVNAPVFGGALEMKIPDATLSDHRLDLVVIGDITLRAIAEAVRGNYSGRWHNVPLAFLAHPSRVELVTQSPEEIACDGEIVATTPVVVETANRALAVIGPQPASASKLRSG
jgi:diacylglycerol kinase (ATP)